VNLFTGNRKRVLGVTLLIAGPVVAALLLGVTLMRNRSPENVLRVIPLFPGARDARYATLQEPSWADWQGETAQVVYRVDEPPQAVFDFYSENLTHGDWQTSERRRQRLEFAKIDGNASGISLKGEAPWFQITHDRVRRMATVIVYRLERNGQEFTEVTLEFTPTAYYRLRSHTLGR
jgi:hypothetical protein